MQAELDDAIRRGRKRPLYEPVGGGRDGARSRRHRATDPATAIRFS